MRSGLLDRKDLQDRLGLLEPQDLPVQSGLPDRKDPPALQDLTARLGLPDRKDPPAPQDLTVRLGLLGRKDPQDRRDLLVLRVSMAPPAPPGLQVLTACRSLRCIGFRRARPAQPFGSEALLWEWRSMDPAFG